jgi:serine/threonine protein phosphatase 1
MKEYNIIQDVAGNYKTLMALLDKMPKDATALSVGDMGDRGPRSKEVFEFFMNSGEAIFGNHEHLMLEAHKKSGYYHEGTWVKQGGLETLQSFYPNETKIFDEYNLKCFYSEELLERLAFSTPPKEVKKILNWLETLPFYKYLEANKFGTRALVSHSAPHPHLTLQESTELRTSYKDCESTIIWNREVPENIEGIYQIFGHNSNWGYEAFSNAKREFAVCLDTSRQRVLTGMHWPSMQVYQQEYIETYSSVKAAFRGSGL